MWNIHILTNLYQIINLKIFHSIVFSQVLALASTNPKNSLFWTRQVLTFAQLTSTFAQLTSTFAQLTSTFAQLTSTFTKLTSTYAQLTSTAWTLEIGTANTSIYFSEEVQKVLGASPEGFQTFEHHLKYPQKSGEFR